MMSTQEVISIYENMADITGQMLAAARTGDWDLLVALESRCSSQVQKLRSHEPLPPLTGPVREQKVRIIRQILADDREIRNLTEPWMARLSVMINSKGTERKLSQAYGAGLPR